MLPSITVLLRSRGVHDRASLTTRHSSSSHLIASYCFVPSHAHAISPGLALGGVWGLREGARRPLAVSNTRLRINSVLNSITRRGTFIGNSAGCLGTNPTLIDVFRLPTLPRPALVYNAFNSSIDSFRGEHDTYGSMAAGALTGALYKSTGTPSRTLSPRSSVLIVLPRSSRCEARPCRGNLHLGPRRCLELC